MPGLKMRTVKRRQLMWLSVGVLLLLVASELLIPGLRRYWIAHPMLASLVAFGATIMLTLLLIDEIRQRQEAKRWESVSHVAQRRLAGAAFKVCGGLLQVTGYEDAGKHLVRAVAHMEESGERPGVEAPPLLPPGYEDNLAELLESPEYRSSLSAIIEPMPYALDEAMAEWAPVMLSAPDLAERLDVFSLMRNTVSWIVGSIERYPNSEKDRVRFWSHLRIFLLLYATFDALRRDLLAESDLHVFGETAVEHDRAWGLPFKAQKWLWEDGVPVPPGRPKRGSGLLRRLRRQGR